MALISPVVSWEQGIEVKSGKLTLPRAPLDYVMNLAQRYQVTVSPAGLDAALLCAAADLPLIHRDPFDRVLIAAAVRERLTLLTADRIIPTYPDVVTLW